MVKNKQYIRMKTKYESLLGDISKELNIEIGDSEDPEMWASRVIYSAVGRMALASLWDKYDDEQKALRPEKIEVDKNSEEIKDIIIKSSHDRSISITHFKRRVKELLSAYTSLYPEIKSLISVDLERLCEEIYEIYLMTGYFYHRNNNITSAIECESKEGNIYLIRGAKLSRKVKMSGLGIYSKESDGQVVDVQSVADMFQLQNKRLDEYWNNIIDKVKDEKGWDSFNIKNRSDLKFLRIQQPFQYGYWQENDPIEAGSFSLLKLGDGGSEVYYFYCRDDIDYKVYRVPEWIIKKSKDIYDYRKISVSLLSSIKELPPIFYKRDCNLVKIKLNYLFPISEQYFFKLYSWPKNFLQSQNFERLMQYEVFEVIKDVFEKIGYTFKEEEV